MNLMEDISRIRSRSDDDLIKEMMVMIRDGVGSINFMINMNDHYLRLERELRDRLEISTIEYPYGCEGDDADDHEIDCPKDQLESVYKIFTNIWQRLKLMRTMIPLNQEDTAKINKIIGYPYLCSMCGVVMIIVLYQGIAYSQCPLCKDRWVIPGLSQGDEEAYRRVLE